MKKEKKDPKELISLKQSFRNWGIKEQEFNRKLILKKARLGRPLSLHP